MVGVVVSGPLAVDDKEECGAIETLFELERHCRGGFIFREFR